MNQSRIEGCKKAIFNDPLSKDAHIELMKCYPDAKRDDHKFSHVFATFNRVEYLKKYITSIRENSFYEYEIIVIANGCSDGTAEYLEGEKDIFVVTAAENMLPNKITNVGYLYATGDYVGGFSDDVEVMPGWDLQIVQTIGNDRLAGVATPLIINPNGSIQTIGACSRFRSDTFLWIGQVPYIKNAEFTNGTLADFPEFQVPRECDYAQFGLMKRECLEKVGLMDSEFEMYFVDTDYGYRAQNMGYKTVFCPTSVVIHDMQSTRESNLEFVKKSASQGGTRLVNRWNLRETSTEERESKPTEVRRSYLYIEHYLKLHQMATRSLNPRPSEDADEMASWIPEDCVHVLVAGNGNGKTVGILKDRYGKQAVGLSAKPGEVQEGVTYLGDITFIPFGNRRFDLVYARHTLEQGFSPLLTLFEFNRVIRTEGFALIAVLPCEERWINVEGLYSILHPMQWRRLFKETGFSIMREEPMFFSPAAPARDKEAFEGTCFLLKKRGDTNAVDTDAIDCSIERHNIKLSALALNAELAAFEAEGGNLEKALVMYEKGFELDPEDRDSLLELMKIGKAIGPTGETWGLIEGRLMRHPVDMDVLFGHAEICHKLGTTNKALESLEKIILFNPENKNVLALMERIKADTC